MHKGGVNEVSGVAAFNLMPEQNPYDGASKCCARYKVDQLTSISLHHSQIDSTQTKHVEFSPLSFGTTVSSNLSGSADSPCCTSTYTNTSMFR